MRGPREKAFTLVEMLVVLAVIGLLAGLLLSALWHARAASRKTSCKSNLRQFGLALASYSDRWGPYPIGDFYSRLYPAYLGDPNVFHCPSDLVAGEDTYSGCFRGGYPTIIGDNLEILFCPCHTGPPPGVFRDGRVADLPQFGGSTQLLSANLGSQNGTPVSYPLTIPEAGISGEPTTIYFYTGGVWNQLTLNGITLTGLYGNNSGVSLAATYSTGSPLYQKIVTSGMCVPMAVDICGINGRFTGTNVVPEVVSNLNSSTNGFFQEIYRSIWANGTVQLPAGVTFTLMMNAVPMKYVNQPPVTQVWPGPPVSYSTIPGTMTGGNSGYDVWTASHGNMMYVYSEWLLPYHSITFYMQLPP